MRTFLTNVRIQWWSVALVVVIAQIAVAPSWVAVAALALLSVKRGFSDLLAHQLQQKQATDTDRLARLEQEVRSLSQATNLKNLGR